MISSAERQSIKFLTLLLMLCFSNIALAQSFTVAANPASLTVYPGEGNVPVTVSVASDSYTGPVSVTLSGLPSGITVTPAVVTIAPGSSGTIMLNIGQHADQEAFAVSLSAPNTATSTIQVVGAVGSTTSTAPISLTVSLSNANFAPASGQFVLPMLNLNTSGVAIVDKTTDVPGTITISSADGSKVYLPSSSDTDNTGVFHLHGNSTLLFPKKAYHVKLNTSIDLLTAMGLTCPYVTSSGKAVCDKTKSYVLLANYDDKTLLRDWSASSLANSIPYGGSFLNETPVPSSYSGAIPTPSGTSALVPWAPHSLFVEMTLNGVYEGVYQLIEEVKVDSHKVNIPELAETQTSGDLSGGYLLEIDQHKGEAYVFNTPEKLPIGVVDPDFTPDPEVPEQTSYISNYVNTAENALFSSTFTDPNLGWRAYYDEASLINFYLVNEIMGNVDGGDFYSSDYLYKTVDNPFLYMGPVWDFDIAAGNDEFQTIVNPSAPWMQTHAIWYEQLFKDPGFKADVATQFNALKSNGVLSTWLQSISTEAAGLEQAQANNFARWPMLGIKVWPNPEASDNYDGEVSYMMTYLNLRIAYLDSLFNSKLATITTQTLPKGTLYQGAPQTLVAHVAGGTTPSGVVTFLSGASVIGTASLDATETATLVTTELELGMHTIQAVYNGDSTNALSSSSAVNVTVVAPIAATVTNLATSNATTTTGSAVTLSVSVVANTGNTVPSGSVTFISNGNMIGTATLTASGTASISVALPLGSNAIQATYAGTTSFSSSSSSVSTVSVNPLPVAITFATSPAGLAYSVDDVSYTSGTTLSLVPGSSHTIATTSPQSSGAVSEAFSAWSDGGAESHTINVPATATSYVATFTAVAPPTTAPVNYPAGFTNSGLSLNGSAGISGTSLQLTSGLTNQKASAYFSTPVNINSFTNDFTFQLLNPKADGFTFVIQSQGTAALGSLGGDLGYGSPVANGGIKNSVAVKFDLSNNAGEGTDSTGIYLDGARPYVPATDLTPSGVNLHSGDILQAHMTYDGTTLSVTITDTVTNASAVQTYTVDIPTAVGGSTAFVGFTAGTGNQSATQDILTWTFAPTTATPPPPPLNYAGGFTNSGLSLNGSAAISGTSLQLTSGLTNQKASAYFSTPVDVTSFTNDFTFQLLNPKADGFTFVIQSQGTSALGGLGVDLGYGSPVANGGVKSSVAIKFDLANDAGEGTNSTGLYLNGARPTVPSTDLTPSGVSLHSGDILQAHMTYDGTTLSVTITDTVTSATSVQTYTVDIPTTVGGGTAFVGFTAGTGNQSATQDILTWTYAPTSSGQ